MRFLMFSFVCRGASLTVDSLNPIYPSDHLELLTVTTLSPVSFLSNFFARVFMTAKIKTM